MPDRFLNLTDGVAMIVSDLHGDLDAFNRALDHFWALRERGQVQRLVLLGDLIHGYGPSTDDDSLPMVLDVIALQQELGEDTVIMLLGNHEMPHIYSVTLSKGATEFTPRFEHALGEHRAAVLGFFKRLPLAIRTQAGVALTHAGPSAEAVYHLDTLRQIDHDAELADADHVLVQAEDLSALFDQYERAYGAHYADMARHCLAVHQPDDARYTHLLRSVIISHQSHAFRALWDALFTQNEYGLPPDTYRNVCRMFLEALSNGAPADQRVAVSGHISTPSGGYTVINEHHLRLASAAHAVPREAGLYLLLDCARPVRTADTLLGGLRPLFDTTP